MKRSYRSVNLGANLVRHITVIESDPCESGTAEARNAIHAVFVRFAEDMAFSDSGPLPFERLDIQHDGFKWIVTAEAVEERDQWI